MSNFTLALVEGLRARREDQTAWSTCTTLDSYVTDRVKELTQGGSTR